MRILLSILLSCLFLLPASAQNSELTPFAKKIAVAIGERAGHTKGKTVRLDYFTLDDTEMGSVFSRELYRQLAIELPKAGTPLRDNTNNLGKQQSFAGKDDYVVCGIYSEKGKQIEVEAYLFDLELKQPIRYIKVAIPRDLLLQNKIPWQPAQLEQARRTRNLIVEDEEMPAPPAPAPAPAPTPEPAPAPAPAPAPLPTPEPAPAQGDFALAMMTSKGFGHQIFTEGELMSIAVQAEKPCFLRLVYHAADGSKVLLLENVPMKVSDEGNYITVPQDFECSAPFGVETLQLFACTEMFPTLRTHLDNGLVFIDEEISAVNAKTRGFKPVSGKGKKGSLAKAEVRLQVTTLPK